MVIRSIHPPLVEFIVSSDDELNQAYRAIHEAAGIPWGGKGGDDPILSPTDLPLSGQGVLAAMRVHLWSFDVELLRTVKAERTRRLAIEKAYTNGGHSFNKVEQRLKTMAQALGRRLGDFLLIEKLGDGLARETWYAAGPVLAELSMDDLEHLGHEMKAQEERAAAKKQSQ
jgi:hypothetical protein